MRCCGVQDLLARLSSSLSPIEQYAVRHLEAQCLHSKATLTTIAALHTYCSCHCLLLLLQDLLARLPSSLSPIERYAVRHLG
jgi:hypothetical protein